jgi:hypothetical protein
MRILTVIQSIFAAAFILFGLLTLFGIGITGLLFLVPGAFFAAAAAIVLKTSRAGAAFVLLADGALAYAAARKLASLASAGEAYARLHHVGVVDYLVPSIALGLVAIGVVAALADWRALREAPWF